MRGHGGAGLANVYELRLGFANTTRNPEGVRNHNNSKGWRYYVPLIHEGVSQRGSPNRHSARHATPDTPPHPPVHEPPSPVHQWRRTRPLSVRRRWAAVPPVGGGGGTGCSSRRFPCPQCAYAALHAISTLCSMLERPMNHDSQAPSTHQHACNTRLHAVPPPPHSGRHTSALSPTATTLDIGHR
jgi:hypothetical protein